MSFGGTVRPRGRCHRNGFRSPRATFLWYGQSARKAANWLHRGQAHSFPAPLASTLACSAQTARPLLMEPPHVSAPTGQTQAIGLGGSEDASFGGLPRLRGSTEPAYAVFHGAAARRCAIGQPPRVGCVVACTSKAGSLGVAHALERPFGRLLLSHGDSPVECPNASNASPSRASAGPRVVTG